ncbi:unnamed protein product [Vitrella brassicaformis CCMP3155]|uniref:Uncharacterized protein n=3 Tax=Vitrella brassicaformis TaxID=1169539 RepID=A0A0G4FQS7_VITBC|nr:unnamed protein product [Vitrella brassicaformis CCMP3155]|eukprot:CEM16570.1 unnamed protein product [Vitrella brassicaformis CCMP3155]
MRLPLLAQLPRSGLHTKHSVAVEREEASGHRRTDEWPDGGGLHLPIVTSPASVTVMAAQAAQSSSSSPAAAAAPAPHVAPCRGPCGDQKGSRVWVVTEKRDEGEQEWVKADVYRIDGRTVYFREVGGGEDFKVTVPTKTIPPTELTPHAVCDGFRYLRSRKPLKETHYGSKKAVDRLGNDELASLLSFMTPCGLSALFPHRSLVRNGAVRQHTNITIDASTPGECQFWASTTTQEAFKLGRRLTSLTSAHVAQPHTHPEWCVNTLTAIVEGHAAGRRVAREGESSIESIHFSCPTDGRASHVYPSRPPHHDYLSRPSPRLQLPSLKSITGLRVREDHEMLEPHKMLERGWVMPQLEVVTTGGTFRLATDDFVHFLRQLIKTSRSLKRLAVGGLWRNATLDVLADMPGGESGERGPLAGLEHLSTVFLGPREDFEELQRLLVSRGCKQSIRHLGVRSTVPFRAGDVRQGERHWLLSLKAFAEAVASPSVDIDCRLSEPVGCLNTFLDPALLDTPSLTKPLQAIAKEAGTIAPFGDPLRKGGAITLEVTQAIIDGSSEVMGSLTKRAQQTAASIIFEKVKKVVILAAEDLDIPEDAPPPYIPALEHLSPQAFPNATGLFVGARPVGLQGPQAAADLTSRMPALTHLKITSAAPDIVDMLRSIGDRVPRSVSLEGFDIGLPPPAPNPLPPASLPRVKNLLVRGHQGMAAAKAAVIGMSSLEEVVVDKADVAGLLTAMGGGRTLNTLRLSFDPPSFRALESADPTHLPVVQSAEVFVPVADRTVYPAADVLAGVKALCRLRDLQQFELELRGASEVRIGGPEDPIHALLGEMQQRHGKTFGTLRRKPAEGCFGYRLLLKARDIQQLLMSEAQIAINAANDHITGSESGGAVRPSVDEVSGQEGGGERCDEPPSFRQQVGAATAAIAATSGVPGSATSSSGVANIASVAAPVAAAAPGFSPSPVPYQAPHLRPPPSLAPSVRPKTPSYICPPPFTPHPTAAMPQPPWPPGPAVVLPAPNPAPAQGMVMPNQVQPPQYLMHPMPPTGNTAGRITRGAWPWATDGRIGRSNRAEATR